MPEEKTPQMPTPAACPSPLASPVCLLSPGDSARRVLSLPLSDLPVVGSCLGLQVLPIDEVRVQQVDLIDILQCGQGQLVKDGLYMYVRKGRHHQSIAFKNLGGDDAAYTVDFTGSENVITNLDSLKVSFK